MNARDAIRRLEAFDKGKPLARGNTLHLQIAEDGELLALAFLRMGGEWLPWAIGLATPGVDPKILAVPDARDRDRVGAMLVEFTPHLAAHLAHPQWVAEGQDSSGNGASEESSLRQVWIPNGSHVQLLHMLNLRYTFARGGDPERAATLRVLGRMAGYLFREAGRLGEATILDAAAALREAFTFPADDLRQQHLGFLLALLQTEGDREKRMGAAEEAEEMSVSISLDPRIERDVLEPDVERYNAARTSKDAGGMASTEAKIRAALARELERRLELTLDAVKMLRNDARPLNAGAVRLAEESTETRQRDFLWLEKQLIADGEESRPVPSPETDKHAPTGAARYHRLSGGAEAVETALIHFDEELQRDAAANGDAVLGELVKVEDRAPQSSRKTIPVWTIEASSSSPTRFRRGSGVCVAGIPKRTGVVLRIEEEGGTRRLEVEINGWKKRPDVTKYPDFAHVAPAADAGLAGSEVVLLSSSLTGINIRKSKQVRKEEGPGSWLTHGNGEPPRRRRRRRKDLLSELDALRK